jgi:LacI family transcriptional regulator
VLALLTTLRYAYRIIRSVHDKHNILVTTSRSDVTIQQVAARVGVSAMTVSRVINKNKRVAPETRRRVEEAILELGYVPNALARGLLKGRTYTIGLLVSDISNPFFTLIARGVEDIAQHNGYTVLFGNSDESAEKERQYVEVMLQNRVDGLLIAPAGQDSHNTLKLLSAQEIPFVLVDRYVEGIAADIVEGDNIGGARLLTEHLIRRGHHRIALVNGAQEVSTARERLLGYQEALLAQQIELDAKLVISGTFTRLSGSIAAEKLLQLPKEKRPTAIFACNNFLAIGVIEALHKAHVRVPDDIAVVSFDDIELASALDPFLTVVAQPARTFGTIAAQFLLDRLKGDMSPARKVVLPPALIVRLSCAGAKIRG